MVTTDNTAIPTPVSSTVTTETQNFLYEILHQLLAAFEELEEGPADTIDIQLNVGAQEDRGLRLSSIGKRARYLAHQFFGTPRLKTRANTVVKFHVGHLLHAYIQEVMERCTAWDVLEVEKNVTLPIAGQEIQGHVDLVLRDKASGQKFLIDIKTTDQYGYVEGDPRNTGSNWWERTRKWASSNYVFDAWESWMDQPFKQDYLVQIDAYREGLEREDIHVDEVVFVVVNRNTLHFAVGIVDQSSEGMRRERDEQVAIACDDALSHPNEVEPCYPAAVGSSPDIRCQYCPYLEACFDVQTTVYRGKPQMKIKSVK